MSRIEVGPDTLSLTRSRVRVSKALLLLFGFSILYFADVFLRASEKYFWFDELGTVYQCRLTVHELWQALMAGFDFNPPLLYVLTKTGNTLFGEGLIVTRLPEIIGFWFFVYACFVSSAGEPELLQDSLS